MPDPKRLTVSATETPLLFNASPYGTRWTLWQKFANGIEMPRDENERMEWGTKMQPLLLNQAAHDLKLEVTPNHSYVSRGPLGCTRDATVYDPSRGPGALETKCVFDYRTWMSKWGGGTHVPREIEIQLQVQMMVGATDERVEGGGRFEWGVIAVWCCAQMYYFERAPLLPLWDDLRTEATAFLQSVRDRVEPDPFGSPIELPLLAQVYPTREFSVLDLTDDEATSEIYTEKGTTYLKAKAAENANKAVANSARAEFIAKLKGHEQCWLAGGARFSMGKRNRLNVCVPSVADVDGGE